MIDRSVHPNTRVLIDAWRRMTADPASHALNGPRANEHPTLLGRIFILHLTRQGSWNFGTAGEDLTRVLGRPVEGSDFLNLWTGPDRAMMTAFIDAVMLDGYPGVVRGRGETMTGQRVEIEMTLAPLARVSERIQLPRLIGLYQTLGGEAMLKGRPVFRHRVSMLVPPDMRSAAPALKLVKAND